MLLFPNATVSISREGHGLRTADVQITWLSDRQAIEAGGAAVVATITDAVDADYKRHDRIEIIALQGDPDLLPEVVAYTAGEITRKPGLLPHIVVELNGGVF